MEELSIIQISTEQLDQLQQISRQTFSEAFTSGNSEANLQDYLEKGFSPTKLLHELRDPNSVFYFAMLHSQPIGYLKLNFGEAQTELKDPKSMEIERIYVLAAFLGKKPGQALLEKAIAIATTKGLDFIWLGVWEENARAIRFYEKNGFVAFDKHFFTVGTDKQTDILMRLDLKPVDPNNLKSPTDQ